MGLFSSPFIPSLIPQPAQADEGRAVLDSSVFAAQGGLTRLQPCAPSKGI